MVKPESSPVTPPPAIDHNQTVALSRVCAQAGQAVRLADHVPLRQAVDLFREQPELFGILVTGPGPDGAMRTTPLIRVKTFQLLAQPFVKEVYFRKSLRCFFDSLHGTACLQLDADTPVHHAIEAALAREVQVRYDPVVVSRDGVACEMIDVRTLINHQRCMLSDVLREVDRQRHEAYQAARRDRLTDLPNRAHALERLKEAANRHAAHGRDYAVLFLDFDHFKVVNDSLGHEVGDQLLIQIAQRMCRTLARFTGRPDADAPGRWVCARLGGDEFLVVLESLAEPNEPLALAQALIEAMKTPFELCGHEVTSSPSIGVTTSRLGAEQTPSAMLRDADAAMYRAKRAGRNRCVLFDRSMHEQSLQRLHVESELRRALERRQLALHYQPIVCSESGHITGFEALMRWTHPDLGEVSPNRFIPIAEEAGLISALDRFALEEALTQLAAWRALIGPSRRLYMSVNVSKRQMLQPDFIDHLRDTLAATGVAPREVNLEVTETVISDRADVIVPVLQQVKQLGVRLSMDDFGTGMSSLTCLHRFPIDTLKIDRGFIQHLEQRTAFTAVVQAIVTLARHLGMDVTVEGVERIEQLAQIQTLECSQVQGYLFSRPVPAPIAERLLLDGIAVLPHPQAA